MIFDVDKIWEIKQKAIESDLHDKRKVMLFGINSNFVAGLEQVDNPADQLLYDLNAMSEAGTIVGGEVPLELWLRNAAYITKVFPERHSYFAGLADEAKAIAAKTAANSVVGPPVPTDDVIVQRQSYLGVGGGADPAPAADPPGAPNPALGDRPDSGPNPGGFPGFHIPDIAVTLSPLLVLAGAVILRLAHTKGWDLLSPIASMLAIWILFRLWRPAATMLSRADPAVSDPQHATLRRIDILLVIFSIAASGLVLQFNW